VFSSRITEKKFLAKTSQVENLGGGVGTQSWRKKLKICWKDETNIWICFYVQNFSLVLTMPGLQYAFLHK
jgi:hypothetical protein